MKKIRAKDLFEYLLQFDNNISISGNQNFLICGFSSLDNYKKGTLTWTKGSTQGDTAISALVSPYHIESTSEVRILSDNPKLIFFKAIELLSEINQQYSIAKTAVIAQTSKIEENVFVGEYTYIGENVLIGQGTYIGQHVVIGDNVVIGENCNIKSGAVIGERGFGYSKCDRKYQQIPHFGTVVIGNDVDVGNNTCIDRGTIDDTEIRNGVKIDNLCHIAHNVLIEEDSIIVANVSIAGSVHIGKNVYVALSSSVLNQKRIGEGAVIGMGAVVTKDIQDETVCAFSPARVIRKRTEEDWKRL